MVSSQRYVLLLLSDSYESQLTQQWLIPAILNSYEFAARTIRTHHRYAYRWSPIQFGGNRDFVSRRGRLFPADLAARQSPGT